MTGRKRRDRGGALKIISGGQTGVDRAALDVALGLGFTCGGWCPRGRLAEDGVIPRRYPLEETPDAQYAQRTEWNVRDSDGTLILAAGTPTGGTAFTIECAARWGKPCLVVAVTDVGGADRVISWIVASRIDLLNVAGPREGTAPEVYGLAVDFLQAVLPRLSR